MKPTAFLRSLLALTGSSLLTISYAQAATLTWDAGGGGGAITNGGGAWLGANLWNNAGVAATWTSGDDAIFAGPATAGGAVTLASPTTVNSLTFSPSFTGTYTLGTAGQALTINNGITKNAGSGAVTIISPITLGGAQTWTNNSATTLQVNTPGVTNAGHQLTIDGTGTTSFGVINNAAVTLSGSGNLVKNGSGRFSFGGNNTGFSGNVTLNGGVTIVTAIGAIGSGNLTMNGGVYEEYWSNTFTRTLGAGAGQVQITGGTSGFSLNGATGMTVRLNNSAAFEVVWGSASFNPSTFVLQAASAQNGSGLTFDNKIDLNGADRTIAQNATTTATATIAQAIRNTSGTAAGIIKTGPGNLILSATNTYDGNTAVNEGILTANTTGALPGFATAGKVTVAAGATLAVRTGAWTAANIDSLRGAATWSATTSNLGFDTTTGNFTYASDITEALSVVKRGSNTLILTGNNTYTGTTRINSATLQAGSATALGNGGDITFGGGTLQYTAASAASDFGSRIKNSGSAITIDTNSQNVGISGIANTNTGGLTKSGAGILTLTGTNSYTGTTTVNAGSLAVNGGTISNSSSVVLAASGASMSITNGGTVNSSGAAAFSASNTTMTVTGGNGVTSTWNLGNQQLGSANNAFSNLQLVIDGAGYAGSAVVTNVNILVWGRTATSSTITLTNGGQMNVNGEIRIGNPYYSEAGGANVTIGGGTATSTFTGNAGQDFYIGYGERTGSKNNVVTVGAGGVLTSIRDMYVGHVNNTQNNDNPTTNNQLLVTGTGTASMRQLSLGYANADTRDATANVVSVTSGGQLSTTGAVYVGRAANATSTSNANTMTVTGTGSSWNAGAQTVYVGHTNNASAASNNNILTVGAGGTVTNVNSLIVGFGTGTETGNQLVVNGSLTATGVTVNANNTLAGSGTITGAVTVNGTVAPGTSIGTLGVTGNTTISGTLQIEVDGGSVDLLAITGDLDISAATLSIVPTGSGATLPSYTILTYTGTLTPASPPPGFLSEGTLPGGYTVDYSTPGQIKLVSGGAPVGFAAWQLANSTAGGLGDDHDNDGVDNGTEFFIYGPVANSGFTALPGVTNTAGTLSVTWTKAAGYTGVYTTNFVVQTSDTLSTWSTAATSGSPNVADTVYINGNNVTYTFPAGTKKFARLTVTGP